MAKAKKVLIKCKGAGTLNIDEMKPLQGALKVLTPENYAKFRAEVERDGFIEPVSIWEDPVSGKTFILNGHQRIDGLKRMREEGWLIPQIPVNYEEADNLKDAQRKILAMASQYGIVNPQGLYDFAVEAGIGRQDIQTYFNFSDFDPDRFLREYFPEGSPSVPNLTLAPTPSAVIGATTAPIPQEQPAPRGTPKASLGEMKEEDFENFDHTCPRCRFGFNDQK